MRVLKSIIRLAGGDAVARAGMSGNKGIEKSYKEGILSQSPCKTDALFAPQLSKQHGAAADAAGFAVDCLHSPRFLVGSMKEDHVVDSTCKNKLKDGALRGTFSTGGKKLGAYYYNFIRKMRCPPCTKACLRMAFRLSHLVSLPRYARKKKKFAKEEDSEGQLLPGYFDFTDFFLFHPRDYYKLSLCVTFGNTFDNLWKS